MKSKSYVFLFVILCIFIILCIFLWNREEVYFDDGEINIKNYIEKSDNYEVVISAVGDCTIGTDTNFSYKKSFNYKYEQIKDYSYFFSGVYDILGNDDLTLANLESVLSDNANTKKVKKFNFKGPTKFVNILKEGSVEIVNVANNHSFDYLEKGYNDTLNTLKSNDIEYCGYENYPIIEINNVRIGFTGILGWNYSEAKEDIDDAIKYFNESNVNLKIFSFHWGEERIYQFTTTQQKIGRYAIDQGVDLVIGHHPHVLEGIEKYKEKHIIYSLGNFVYGGTSYTYDKDSVIFQIKLVFDKNKKLIDNKINLIPVSITSSGNNTNDYRPKVLNGKEKERVIKKILKYSVNFNYNIDD